MDKLFEIKNLSVSYGGREVLKNLNLSVDGGTLCAVLGLNGSGKTTLIRAACGLVSSKGEISVSGIDTMALNEKKRARYISYIPQVTGVSEGISVTDTVLMGFNSQMKLLGTYTMEHYERCARLLESVGMSGYAKRDFSTLSQGEKQMVILARCMAQDAPVMLMDEPDSSLDFLNRHKMLSLLRKTVREKNMAGLVAVHDPNFALRYCDRIFILQNGRITDEIETETADAPRIKKALDSVYKNVSVTKTGAHYSVSVEAEQ